MATLPDVRGSAVQLQAIVKDICQVGATDDVIAVKMEKAMVLLEDIPHLDLGRYDHRCVHGMLESLAVQLWNHMITVKNKGCLSSQNSAQLRHISCILEQKCNDGSHNEHVLKKVVMMSLKTGRAWLDVGNPERANLVLQLSTKYVERLQILIINRKNNGDSVDREKTETEKDRFKLLCYQAEAAVMLRNFSTARNFFTISKGLISYLPKEGAILSMLCYNFGVEAFQLRDFQECVFWLRESYEIGKDRVEIGPKNQSRTLRLLANSYLEWNEEGHLQKALNAIALAESEHCHYSALYIRLNILLLTGESEEKIQSCMEDILNHPDSSLELGLNSVDLLCSSNRRDIAVKGLQKLQSKYEHHPDVAKVCIKHLELSLQSKLEEEAKAYAEQMITGHYSDRPLDVVTRKRFHMIFWEHAADLFEGKCYEDALQWYNFSLSIYTSDVIGKKNLAKLHRNRVACYLALGHLQKAAEASVEAEKADRDSPYTHYILLRVAIAEADVEKAKLAVKNMSGTMKTNEEEKVSAEEQHGLICLAAQIAFESEHQEVALVALEELMELGGDASMTLTALRCLIRLQLKDKDKTGSSRADIKKIRHYLNTACEHLQHAKGVENSYVDVQKESSWFMKIAWNMALQSKECHGDMRELFRICNKLTSLCGEGVDDLSRQKTCLMMIIACDLQLARQKQVMEEKKEILQEALLQLGDCKRISEKLRNLCLSDLDVKRKDTAEILLLLYEFEAKTKLGDPDVESVLERALSLPYSEPKTYETMAALAMESPAQNRKISMRALKAAIRKHLQTEPVDLTRLSQAFHSLVSLALQADNMSDTSWSEEAFSYYKEVFELLNKFKESYPEMETLWLMTKAWNRGIYLYSADHYEEAEKWCSMSLNFLTHLPTMKSNYEEQMNTIYGEILSKIENRNISSMEE